MFYKQVSENKLKIILSPKDMEELNIAYSELEVTCPLTRSLVLGLLGELDLPFCFNIQCHTLLVELYPTKPGGCVITYTAIERPTTQICPYQIFVFPDGYTLINAVLAVFSRYSNLIYKSSLYSYHGRFYLGVSTLDKDGSPVSELLGEYAQQLTGSMMLDSYINEHMEMLLEEDALDKLYKLCGKAQGNTLPLLP